MPLHFRETATIPCVDYSPVWVLGILWKLREPKTYINCPHTYLERHQALPMTAQTREAARVVAVDVAPGGPPMGMRRLRGRPVHGIRNNEDNSNTMHGRPRR